MTLLSTKITMVMVMTIDNAFVQEHVVDSDAIVVFVTGIVADIDDNNDYDDDTGDDYEMDIGQYYHH